MKSEGDDDDSLFMFLFIFGFYLLHVKSECEVEN